MVEENIIETYDKESRERIRDKESVSKYKKELENYRVHLRNIKLNYSSILKKLCHPIIVLKTSSELKKVDKIERKLDEMLDSSLVMYFDEETGDLKEDLNNALEYYKPKHIEAFIAENKIDTKKLVKHQDKY